MADKKQKSRKVENLEEVAGELHIDESKIKPPKLEESADKDTHSSIDLEKIKSEYLYLRAEFDNFRKNAIKERSDLIKYGAERFIRQLLQVIDNFDLALATEVNVDNYQKFREGVELTATEFRNALENMGVTVEDPLGKAFDPMIHEALSSEESAEVTPGHVVRVYKKAYKLHEKVIRPAQVVVAVEKRSSGSESNGDAEENKE